MHEALEQRALGRTLKEILMRFGFQKWWVFFFLCIHFASKFSTVSTRYWENIVSLNKTIDDVGRVSWRTVHIPAINDVTGE